MALPTGACATSIAMCMVLGTALAVGLNWKARRPAYTYVVVACVLTFVSLGGPLVAAGTSAGTKFALIVAHLIAAAMIIPLVARCLAGGVSWKWFETVAARPPRPAAAARTTCRSGASPFDLWVRGSRTDPRPEENR